jgi:hypothetical protein
MDTVTWLVMNYTLPKEPSRARVSIWRKLKKTGAVNIQQSMWILPDTEANMASLSAVKEEIVTCNGEAYVLKCCPDEESNCVFIRKFSAARDEEYKELLEQCEEFFKEIEKETARMNFTFAETEENEEELEKLNKWFNQISARDYFSAPLKAVSEEALSGCAAVLEEFCESVYESNKEGM